jgi:hypothetical protein
MSTLPANISDLMKAEKKLLFRPQWDDVSDPRYVVFTVPLDGSGLSVGRFELRAKVSKQFVDRDALMQLEFARTARDRVGLARCQWRPFETHINKAWGPEGFALKTFDRDSHHHPFGFNYLPNEGRMRRGNLPAAVPINPDPATLSEFFVFCGQCFNIENIKLVSLPSRTPDLFWVPNDR